MPLECTSNRGSSASPLVLLAPWERQTYRRPAGENALIGPSFGRSPPAASMREREGTEPFSPAGPGPKDRPASVVVFPVAGSMRGDKATLSTVSPPSSTRKIRVSGRYPSAVTVTEWMPTVTASSVVPAGRMISSPSRENLASFGHVVTIRGAYSSSRSKWQRPVPPAGTVTQTSAGER